ncbi:MAG: DUF4105 domain-containing protein [Bdellovibrionales bacterium]|nr:DUF4105 domain-containing protein [Bdellovibrionales bacterium]
MKDSTKIKTRIQNKIILIFFVLKIFLFVPHFVFGKTYPTKSSTPFSSSISPFSSSISPFSSSLQIPREQLDSFSHSPQWLRLFQYEKTFFGKWKSAIHSTQYFFSEKGFDDPGAEMQAALSAFSQTTTLYGTQKQPAACVFPARKKILENLLKTSFPSPSCPDLKQWQNTLEVKNVYLVFVGAYMGNPASLLGHSFLRLSKEKESTEEKSGQDLLSYSVGFLAQSQSASNKMMYMLKGLTGGFPGFYEIEPHYMKVGLYNNSESRDLWEIKVHLTQEQMDLLVLHLWELTFNAQFNYYFLDENCSFRLIKLLEAIQPEMNISSKLSQIVLPAETVREVMKFQSDPTTVFYRPSIKRKIQYKVDNLSPEQKKLFFKAKSSVKATEKLKESSTIDALLDFWIYQNYQVQTHLEKAQKEIMTATYKQMAANEQTSKYSLLSNEALRQYFSLKPPFLSHPPRVFSASWNQSLNEKDNTPPSTQSLSFRWGAHPFWVSDLGRQDTSSVEYLGFDLEHKNKDRYHWQFLLLQIQSIEDILSFDHSWSWQLNFSAKNSSWFSTTLPADDTSIHIHSTVSGGLGTLLPKGALYSLLQIHNEIWNDNKVKTLLAPGILLGLKLRPQEKITLVSEGSQSWWNHQYRFHFENRFSYLIKQNKVIYLSYLNTKSSPQPTSQKLPPGSHQLEMGLGYFF